MSTKKEQKNIEIEKKNLSLGENLKIAFLQILPGNSIEENLTKGLDACRTAKTLGADIALFPEMWSSGYF